MVDGAVTYILDMFTETYVDLLDRIPEKQSEVFIAIAREAKPKPSQAKPSSRSTISRLSASSQPPSADYLKKI